MKAEEIAQMVVAALEDDPDESVTASVSSDPAEVWVTTTDDQGMTREFRLTVESQP